MQSLSPELYARLHRLATSYADQHIAEYRHDERRNARLGVDTLCFQWHARELLGILITPVSLSLLLVAPGAEHEESHRVEERVLELPSGRYLLRGEWVAGEGPIWRCELLAGLEDIEDMLEASRLAQRVMRQVMSESS
ncbi:hypothetical protein GCM10027040_29020 [Halomonas shantousis]